MKKQKQIELEDRVKVIKNVNIYDTDFILKPDGILVFKSCTLIDCTIELSDKIIQIFHATNLYLTIENKTEV
jgi:hypothetical protein